MPELKIKQIKKRENTLLAALLLSAPGPLVTLIAAITSRSATQIADFLRRTTELIALFVSWWVFRRLKKNTDLDRGEDYSKKLERIANLTVGFAMIVSAAAMFIVGIIRFFVFKVTGNVVLGYIIAILGLLTNSFFWWRYKNLLKESYNAVIYGQEKLYRAKAIVDLGVVIALTAVIVAPLRPITQYIDALGCIFVAFYLLISGVGVLKEKDPEKADSALIEKGESLSEDNI